MASYIPSASDFEREHSYPAHYPPFPRRLLNATHARGNVNAAPPYRPPMSNAFSMKPSTPRRVRPVPIAPPPGFESYQPNPQNQARAAAVSVVRPQPSTNHATEEVQHGYAEYAKLRAVAGALAGDWSRNRPTPDIPQFLLASFMDHQRDFMRDPVDVMDALFSKQNLSFGAVPDLAHFCRNNNISSNILSSASGKPAMTRYHPAAMSSRLDSRLMAPLSATSADSDLLKRRLAPTAVTTEHILSTGTSRWHQQLPHDPTVKHHQTPTKQIVVDSQTFNRTPRAPRTSLLSQKLAESATKSADAEEKVKSGVYAYFQPAYRNDDGPSPITQPASDNPSPEPNSTGVFKVREKIPPAAESTLERKISQRQKQIDIGKNTVEYANYRRLVSRKERKRGDPMTPDKFQDISKRNWEGQMKAWRRRMHEFEPPSKDANNETVPRKFTAPRDVRVDDVVPVLEEGELLAWQQEDEKWMEPYGGVNEWEKFMLEHVRNRMAAQKQEQLNTIVEVSDVSVVVGFEPVLEDGEIVEVVVEAVGN